MKLDWQSAWPGPATQPVRDRLALHLAALLDQPLEKVPLDGALVEDARRSFSRVTLAERVYSAIKGSPAARAVPPWRPADAAGASGVRVFIRRSGAPLTDGVPGFYTVDGFYKVLLPALPAATRQVASESWVLGKDAQIDPASPQVLTLQHDVVVLYTADYAKQWDALLGDLDVEPMRNLQQAVQELYILASPQSPMRDLLAGITRQLSLTQPPQPLPGAAGAAVGAAQSATTAASQAAGGAAAGLQGLFGQTNGPPPEPPGKAIETRYAALIAFVGKGPGAPIDNVLKLLNDLQVQLAKLAAAPAGGAAAAIGGGDDPAQLLQAEASRDPQPVARWLQAMAISGNQLRGGGALDQVKKAFGAPGGPASLCKQAVAGRYPFFSGSPNDIPLDDFATLFAPGGLLDKFFNDNLACVRRYLGRRPGRRSRWPASAPPGHAGRPGAVPARVADPRPVLRHRRQPADRALRHHADRYRRKAGDARSRRPARRVCARPAPRDVGDLAGANRMISVRLVFDPPPSSGPPVLQATGPWALFRVFGQGTLQQRRFGGSLHAQLRRRRSPRIVRNPRRLGAQPVCPRRAAGLPVSGPLTPVALPGGGVPGPEPASPQGRGVGFYGKLPARGDFVRAGLPRDFTDRWDDWLQSVIAGSRSLMGEAWLPAFLEAPVWRFALPPRHVRRQRRTRPDAAERRQAGRYFPLTFAALPAAGATLPAAGIADAASGAALPAWALPKPHRARASGSIVARLLDEPPWNRIRHHRRLPERLARRICRRRRGIVEARGGARARRASSRPACVLAASAGCGNLCGDAGSGCSGTDVERTAGPGRAKTTWESLVMTPPRFPFLGGDTSRRQSGRITRTHTSTGPISASGRWPTAPAAMPPARSPPA